MFDKKYIFDSPPMTCASLTNQYLVFTGILMLYNSTLLRFGQNSPKTTTFCSILGVGLVEHGEVGQYSYL